MYVLFTGCMGHHCVYLNDTLDTQKQGQGDITLPRFNIIMILEYILYELDDEGVAIRPQTVISLCISVIPGSVMLTHTVLEDL